MNDNLQLPVRSNEVPKIKVEDYLTGNIELLSVEEALSEGNIIVDVRTAEEFSKGSVPDALSRPLFDNLERAEIGKIYKQIGRDAAVEKGLKIIEPRLQDFLTSLADLKSYRLVVYCARGGMRSASVVRLLQQNGFRVVQMRGGYKRFRQYVLQQLENPMPSFIVLHGQTGVGKTLLLKKLPDHLDLEGLAGHRSSLFGAINKTPRSQKNFEGLLVQKLRTLPYARPLFVEGESRKVGQVFIPQFLANAMKSGMLVFIPQHLANAMKSGMRVLLSASMKTRINRIVEEYQICDEQSFQQVDSILISLRVSLGKLKVDQLRLWLQKEEIEKIVYMLLADYYDPLYMHSMSGYQYVMELSAEDLNLAADELIRFRNEVTKSQ